MGALPCNPADVSGEGKLGRGLLNCPFEQSKKDDNRDIRLWEVLILLYYIRQNLLVLQFHMRVRNIGKGEKERESEISIGLGCVYMPDWRRARAGFSSMVRLCVCCLNSNTPDRK